MQCTLWQTACDCFWSPYEHACMLCSIPNVWSPSLPSLAVVLPFLPLENPLPVLVPDICLPVPGSSIYLFTARSDFCLLCTRVMFSWSMLLGCCEGRAESGRGRVAWSRRKPRKSCPSSKVVGCSSLPCSHGITVAWLMVAVRTRTVLRAENRVFGGCSWQTLKPLVSF